KISIATELYELRAGVNVASGAGRGLWKRRFRRLQQQKLIVCQGGQGRRPGRG
ncbi:unnamed protein product, partial [Ectocarpus sp. 8 AP-2014]